MISIFSLSAGLDPFYTDDDFSDYTVLHHLARKGEDECMERVLNTLDEDDQDKLVAKRNKYGGTPVYVASLFGKLEAVKFLEGKGADLNGTTKDGESPFWIASKNGHLEVVEYLYNQSVDWKASDVDGKSPLWIASFFGHLDVAKFIVAIGGDVNQKTNDKRGISPLQIAVMYGHYDIFRHFLENGGLIDDQTREGDTAFYLAAEHGQMDILK